MFGGELVFKPLHVLLPDPEVVLSLEPEELAGVLLEYLHLLPPQARLSLFDFSSTTAVVDGYPWEHREAILRAFVDAWRWLERDGLLVPKRGPNDKVVVISERGATLRTAADVAKYRQILLSVDQLHPDLEVAVGMYLQGEYEIAIVQAFKEVEIAVRRAVGQNSPGVGVPLMRYAFDRDIGPLTDRSRAPSEQESVALLFAGAIGLFKEPHGHRDIKMSDPVEAVEMLIVASHLLRIVSARRSASI